MDYTAEELMKKYEHLLYDTPKHEQSLTDHIFGAMAGAEHLEELLPPSTDQKQKMLNILNIIKFMKSVLDNIEYNANTQIKLIEIEEDSHRLP